jgi:hypothetical protein
VRTVAPPGALDATPLHWPDLPVRYGPDESRGPDRDRWHGQPARRPQTATALGGASAAPAGSTTATNNAAGWNRWPALFRRLSDREPGATQNGQWPPNRAANREATPKISPRPTASSATVSNGPKAPQLGSTTSR